VELDNDADTEFEAVVLSDAVPLTVSLRLCDKLWLTDAVVDALPDSDSDVLSLIDAVSLNDVEAEADSVREAVVLAVSVDDTESLDVWDVELDTEALELQDSDVLDVWEMESVVVPLCDAEVLVDKDKLELWEMLVDALAEAVRVLLCVGEVLVEGDADEVGLPLADDERLRETLNVMLVLAVIDDE
jgi:hypothetical protein